jgi:hypothetical protein
MWKGATIEGLTRLLRRSAFAQEVFLLDPNETRRFAFSEENPAVSVNVAELSGEVLVALGWNYLIESEGTLDDRRREGRVKLTADLLLDPYITSSPSRASTKLRRAKKTTLSLSHDLHIYKAKFFPRMVRALLNIFGENGKPVFDPFCGSGTALLEASLLGTDSFGTDIDPIAN